jgi:NhaP-type Na+/H+ or K+/H+ antiporter
MHDMHLGSSFLCIAGIAITGGLASALLFRRMTVPQVLGYIAVGLLLGRGGFGLITRDAIRQWQPFTFFALGVIGFIVGSSIKTHTLQRYGKQFLSILFFEGVCAFVFVGVVSTLIMYFVMHSWVNAAAAGIVFAAIASATDPASTINVLKEYRAAGILTTTVFAIVAFDDALAMVLYGVGSGVSRILSGGSVSVLAEIGIVIKEVAGSAILGGLAGYGMAMMLRRTRGLELHISALMGLLLITVWVCVAFHMDVILASMAMGLVTANVSQGLETRLSTFFETFAAPVYVLFFVLVGARLHLGAMPLWILVLAGGYIVLRSLGKVAGAYIGARRAHADMMVRRYAGTALFSQGGVAIGLAMMASHHLRDITVTAGMHLGDVIVFCVTATTFIVQIIGPPMVKFAISRAGERGRDVSRDDIIERWRVADVMDRSVDPLYAHTTLRTIVSFFTVRHYTMYPVLAGDNRLVGIVTMQEIRDLLMDQQCWDWIVASDVMRDPHWETVDATTPLHDALQVMDQAGTDELIAVQTQAGAAAQGVVNKYEVRHKVDAALLQYRGEE